MTKIKVHKSDLIADLLACINNIVNEDNKNLCELIDTFMLVKVEPDPKNDECFYVFSKRKKNMKKKHLDRR